MLGSRTISSVNAPKSEYKGTVLSESAAIVFLIFQTKSIFMSVSTLSDDLSVLNISESEISFNHPLNQLASSPLMATTSNNSGLKLANLTSFRLDQAGKKFQLWKTVIKILLTSEPDCYEVVTGQILPTNAKYQKANVQARAIILNSLDFALIDLLFDGDIITTTAADAFTKIQEEFESVTNLSEQTATKKVINFRFDPTKTPSQNLKVFRGLVKAAVAAGAHLNNSILVPCLIEALPPSWAFLKQTWGTQSDDRQTISKLYAMIEAEQVRLLSEAQATGTTNTNNTQAVYYSQLQISAPSQQYRQNNHNRNNYNRPRQNQNGYWNDYQNHYQNSYQDNSQSYKSRYHDQRPAPPLDRDQLNSRPNYQYQQSQQQQQNGFGNSRDQAPQWQPAYDNPRERPRRGNFRGEDPRAHFSELVPPSSQYPDYFEAEALLTEFDKPENIPAHT